jgi:hypothetical protein
MLPHVSEHMPGREISGLFLLQLIVSAVIAIVALGAVPFAIGVSSRLASIEENLKQSARMESRLTVIESEVTDLRVRAAKQP